MNLGLLGAQSLLFLGVVLHSHQEVTTAATTTATATMTCDQQQCVSCGSPYRAIARITTTTTMATRQLQVAKPNSCPCPVKIKLFYHQCRISLGPGIIRNQSGVTKALGTHYHTHSLAHRHIDKDEGKDVPRMSVCMQHSSTWVHRGQWLCAHPCSAEANAEW